MKKKKIVLGLLSGLVLLTSGAVMADIERHTPTKSAKHVQQKHEYKRHYKASGYLKLRRMAHAMGGLEKILALKGMQFAASGSRFEPEQGFRPAGAFMPIVDYDYNLINAFGKQQSRTEWLNQVKYPFIEQRQFTEIINGQQGAVLGFDTIIAPPQAPMLSTRLGARVKQNLLSSPLALLHRANRMAKQVQFVGIRKYHNRPHQVISIPGWDQPIRLYIDMSSKLPAKAETLEDDSVYGDTLWEVVYSDWVEVGDIRVPAKLTHIVKGRTINNEARDSFSLLANIDSQQFAIPAELQSVFNPDQFAWGIRSSQWFNRLLSISIPFDLDQRTAATSQIVEVAAGIFHARALTHHSMIIEMQDYLVVVEAPLYDERSQTVLTAIKQRWPNKPVKYLVATHFHNDHIGGIRGYAAVGATLIVGEGTRKHYKTILEATHSVYPDSFSGVDKHVKIRTVSAGDDLVLTDGTRRIRIFDVANRHATGTIVPYVEDTGLVFVSDLYSPQFFPGPMPSLFQSWSVDLLAALETKGLEINTLVGGHGGVSSYEDFVNQVNASL